MHSTTQHVLPVRRQATLAEWTGALLRLIRPANVVTAAADVLAGAMIVDTYDSVGSLLFATCALYAGGVVLNDYFDRHLDAVERPERPIPRGVVSSATAATLGFVLLACGIAAGFTASSVAGLIAALIAVLVIFYNGSAKHHSIGPVVMGTCRGLNLLLGLAVAPRVLPKLWPLALIPLAYIAAITALSRGEVHGGSRRVSALVLGVFSVVVVGVATVGRTQGALLFQLPFLAFLLFKVGGPLWHACKSPTAYTVGAGVHAGIVSLVVVDAALVAGFSGLVYGAALLSLSVVTAELARRFPVT